MFKTDQDVIPAKYKFFAFEILCVITFRNILPNNKQIYQFRILCPFYTFEILFQLKNETEYRNEFGILLSQCSKTCFSILGNT